jgi:hypothetical protein
MREPMLILRLYTGFSQAGLGFDAVVDIELERDYNITGTRFTGKFKIILI